jgi:hypothetical protein
MVIFELLVHVSPLADTVSKKIFHFVLSVRLHSIPTSLKGLLGYENVGVAVATPLISLPGVVIRAFEV